MVLEVEETATEALGLLLPNDNKNIMNVGTLMQQQISIKETLIVDEQIAAIDNKIDCDE